MPVTAVHKDTESLTMTITAEYAAPVERVWQLWSDPRQLERWWGPPSYPATFTSHELAPGGEATYFMTSPEGERYHGWWRIVSLDAPKGLSFEDGFADAGGNRNDALPVTRTSVSIEERPGGGSAMTITATFPSLEAMQQLIEMGMEEGIQLALGQADAILAE
jgi:uncharacterized protein YndB with AHSA1/START domain